MFYLQSCDTYDTYEYNKYCAEIVIYMFISISVDEKLHYHSLGNTFKLATEPLAPSLTNR